MTGLSIFQSGPKGTKMDNPIVFDHLGPYWADLGPFEPFQTKMICLPQIDKVLGILCKFCQRQDVENALVQKLFPKLFSIHLIFVRFLLKTPLAWKKYTTAVVAVVTNQLWLEAWFIQLRLLKKILFVLLQILKLVVQNTLDPANISTKHFHSFVVDQNCLVTAWSKLIIAFLELFGQFPWACFASGNVYPHQGWLLTHCPCQRHLIWDRVGFGTQTSGSLGNRCGFMRRSLPATYLEISPLAVSRGKERWKSRRWKMLRLGTLHLRRNLQSPSNR